MKKSVIILFDLLFSLLLFSNDGAYFASGNQLSPIEETDISITKEVLDIVRTTEYGKDGYAKDYLSIMVDYTFYNPKKQKTLLVGFEASPPVGDVDDRSVNGEHPYIKDFTVMMNNTLLAYNVATPSENRDGYYVYHFNATFKQGLNKIIHTYKFPLSNSVMTRYNFDYILTAAKRWANKQIDDFTLNIDLGNNESFYIENAFFSDKDPWQVEDGRRINHANRFTDSFSNEVTQFITFSKGISFSKKNFKPKGELSIVSPNELFYYSYNFDYLNHNLPKTISLDGEYPTRTKAANENSFKILRNLPFAIRGYVFKTKMIQDYYLTQKWYKPNPSYQATSTSLNAIEKQWLEQIMQKSKKAQ